MGIPMSRALVLGRGESKGVVWEEALEDKPLVKWPIRERGLCQGEVF